MFNFLRARKSNQLILTFAIRKGKVHLVVVEPQADGPPSLVVSDERDAKDNDFATAIQQLAHEYARYCRGQPRLSLVLGSGFYQSVALDRPNLPEDEIATSLRYNLRDLIDVEPENCIADYYELPVQLPGHDKIHAIAANKSQLEQILPAIHDVSDNVIGIFAEEQAIREMFTSVSEPAVLVYQQPQQAALLQVYREGVLQVNRSVRALENISELSIEEVRMGGLQPLSVEIQRSADYFERQLRQRPITDVVLAMAMSKNEEVLAKLHEDLGLTANWAEYPAWASELGAGDYSDFAALGGALMSCKLEGRA
ncbi:hypothetical protein [Pseudidiomarina terrestris]|uniref:MSHA biogenesis protein MshI n=1 Tax=Pseudidiomarina terrestris TaxID=2820060 RepID=A0ABT8MHL8_9GAMM|nr:MULTISPECIES: hypothetical protein [unclassified Pseudidiomarina]MDN7129446.1 hypothetical protein [Pseudidiomarina sp. 1APR75-15]MDN7134289.1 hypothetical protein [Pseudidiomarina sp. 1ASP75-5]